MRKILLLISLVYAFSAQTQEMAEKEADTKEPKKISLVVDMKHNSVAGFYPVFLGNYPLKEKVDLTFYNIFWTNPSFGNAASGSDLLLENGVGLGFKMLDKKLYVNPTLGFAHGKFLTGGKSTLLAEGLVPNLFVLYGNKRIELEGYLGYYVAMREAAGNIPTKDFILNWIVPSIKLSNSIHLGPYYESFTLSRHSDAAVKTGNVYQWLGGHLTIKMANKTSFRFAAGSNVDNQGAVGNEFYKVSVFFPLN